MPGFANIDERDGALLIMPPSARGDVVPKDDKGEYTIQGKLIYRSLEMYYVLVSWMIKTCSNDGMVFPDEAPD